MRSPAPSLRLLVATLALWPALPRAFSAVAIGDPLPERDLPALSGGKVPWLGKARACVFVFFRPGQDHSLQALRQLAQLERELAAKPVRFVAVTSSSYPQADVAATVAEAGIHMPVLVDEGDALYGELGVIMHPSVGIAGEDHRLAATQHFLKINLRDALRARILRVLGEISETDLAAVLDPPPPPASETNPARRRLALARMLLARGHAARAAESARLATEADPGLAEAQAVLGQALAALGRCAEAEAAFAAARRLDPAAPGSRGRCPAPR